MAWRRFTGASWQADCVMRRPIPVLMYHHVSPKPGLVTVSPENFRAHMAWLAGHGWRTLTTAEFAACLAGAPVPKRAVLITFDDGYLDNWVYAHPVLAEFGLKAVLFLITGWMGEGAPRPHAGEAATEQPMPDVPDHKGAMAAGRAWQEAGDTVLLDGAFLRWSEVEAMRMAGTFEFHSHTHRHIRWDKTVADQDERDRALAEDLASSRSTLTARLGAGEADWHLCWPQGYFDAAYQRIATGAGFRYLYTTEPGVARAGTDPARIPRIVVKDKPAGWFGSRLRLYGSSLGAALYLRLKGGK